MSATSEGNVERGRKSDRTRRNGEGSEHVYNRVRILRIERGLSQIELAAELGINHRTLGYLEREHSQPTISLAWEIADYFGLPVGVIFSPEPLEPMSRVISRNSRKKD